MRRWRYSLAWIYRKNLDDLRWMARSGLFRRLRQWDRDPDAQPAIFVFHTVDPSRFREQLQFLMRNGYRTLRAHELLDPSVDTRRAVVLTFDDARESLWKFAFPALREFGLVATSFVVTGCVPEWENRSSEAQAPGGTGLAETGLCTWPEIEEMAASGVLEFQSHTHRHLLVETEPVLAGFLTPDLLGREFANTHLPLRIRELVAEVGPEGALGAPIFASAPLLAARRMLKVAPQLTERCREAVQRGGGRRFFSQPGWLRILRHEYGRACREARLAFSWHAAEEYNRLVLDELTEARRVLQARIGGPADQLCLPWFVADRGHLPLIQRAGYRAVHWGAQPAAWLDLGREGLRHFWRVDECFLQMLPGAGSISVAEVLRIRLRNAFTRASRSRV